MIEIFWFTLWIATVIFLISYMKIRERIPTAKRNIFEKVLMFGIIILLLVDISLLIYERREISMEMNDCIRFYRYFPYCNDSEFYFVNEWCYEYFTPDEIQRLRESGMGEPLRQGDFDIGNLLEGGNTNG